MSQPEWKFRIPQDSEVNQDPVEGEFFTTQDVGDFSDALVRESIQNSLDAKQDKNNPGQVVTIRYYFSGQTNATEVGLETHQYFKGIYSHIIADDNGLDKNELPPVSEKAQFIVIEDFQTQGLDGSIEENDDPKTDAPMGHNFYWFWRNVGRSGKKGSERGKWGLGKTVFPASSRINTFFAFTNRYDDNKSYLMGLSVLKTHHTNAEAKIKRYPYGYFGVFESKDQFFATPTDDHTILENFRATFNLKREIHNSSGLSVVIPFPRKEITSATVINSILKQYFYPVIGGGLVVEVIDDDKNMSIVINDKTIFELLLQRDFNLYNKLFELCLWSYKLPGAEYVILNKPPLANSARWQMDWFLNDEIRGQLENKILLFEQGKPVAFNIPVRIKEANMPAQFCFFKVFLEKDESLGKADAHFVRDGITVTGAGRKVKNKSVRAIVVIEDKPLVKLLGLAENPAHTEWQENSSHFRGRYDDGNKVIGFIELSVDKLCGLLLKPAEGIDRKIMRDVFYIDLPDLDEEPAEPDDEPDDEPGVEPDKPSTLKIKPKKTPFQVTKEKGGFRLVTNPDAEGFGGKLEVAVAYVPAKGSPLKRYSKYDFDLSQYPIVVTSRGVTKLERKENGMSFYVDQDDDFLVEVCGFDEDRDLYIKANYYDSEI